MQTGETFISFSDSFGNNDANKWSTNRQIRTKNSYSGRAVILGYGSYKLCFLDTNTTSQYVMWMAAVRGVRYGTCDDAVNTREMNDVPQSLMSKATSLSSEIRMFMSAVL
jgi:hypothetical protein